MNYLDNLKFGELYIEPNNEFSHDSGIEQSDYDKNIMVPQ